MIRNFLVISFLAIAGLSHAQELDAVVEKYKDLSDRMVIFDMLVDNQNSKWIATDQGLYKITSINSQPQHMDKNTVFKALGMDRQGQIYSGTDAKEIKDESLEVKLILEGEGLNITSMAFHRGLIYIGTNQGLFTYNPKLEKTSRSFTKSNSRLPNDQINMLLADSRDQLWIGTDEGLVKMKKNRIRDVNEKGHKFWAATETKEGIWVVSDKEMWLLDFLESDKWERWRPAALRRGLSKGQVRGIASDSRGRLFLASETLVMFDPYQDDVVKIDQDYGFVSSDALALICDKNDDLWVGTGDQGLFRIDIVEGESEAFSAVAFVKEEIVCHGRENGEVGLKINGGKKPYTIQWNTLTGNLNETKLENLSASNYTATVTDADNQRYVATTELTQPDPIDIELINMKPISALGVRDGGLEVNVTGGTEPYKLRWSNGRRDVETVEGLNYGDHTLTVIDANRCEFEKVLAVGKPKVLPQLDVSTVEIGQTLRIEQLYFKADSAEVQPQSYPVLDEIYEFLSDNRNIVVEIGGHTNGIPSHEYCDKLSTERAQNVAEYLYEKGIETKQIVYKGYGKRQPIATNRSKQGRQRNQRVELKIIDIIRS